MLPKVITLDLDSGKYMLLPNDEALIKKLLHFQNKKIPDPVITLAKAILKNSKNKVVLDIGANVGSFSIPLAMGNASDFKFYCFEIQRVVYYQLCGNIFLNSLDNIYPYNIGVGNKSAYIDIPTFNNYGDCGNVGGFSIDPMAFKFDRMDFPAGILNWQKREKAVIRTIDSITEIAAAALIKIDVEGHELEVLQGAINYIKKSGYPPILFEAWQHDWFRPKLEMLINFLKNLGYNHISNETWDDNFLAQSDLNSNLFIEFRKSSIGQTQIAPIVKK